MELKPYHLRITFDVQVAPWRIDDPKDYRNEWSLWVFDKSKNEWVPHFEWTRPGEFCEIVKIEILDEIPKEDE